MMDTATLLSILRERDVRLWVEEKQLKCSAPVGAFDAELRTTLASRKEEILAFLRQAEAVKSSPAGIVPIKAEGRRAPIFAVSGHGADAFALLGLARHLDAEQPMLGVQPPGLDGSEPLQSVEELARYEIVQIRRCQPQGPYFIAGHCAGGTIAFEVAQQLTSAGQQVALVALIGSPFPTMFRRATQRLRWFRRHAPALTSGSLAERQRYIVRKLQQRINPPLVSPSGTKVPDGVSPAMLEARLRVESATMAACCRYKPKYYPAQIDLFVTRDWWHRSDLWRAVAGTLREHSVGDFEIDDLLIEEHVWVLAESLQDALRSAYDAVDSAGPRGRRELR